MKPRGQFIIIKGMIQNEAIIDLQVQNDNKTATTKTTQQKQSRKHFTYA